MTCPITGILDGIRGGSLLSWGRVRKRVKRQSARLTITARGSVGDVIFGSMNCQTQVRLIRCNRTWSPRAAKQMGDRTVSDVQNPRAEVPKTHSRNPRSDNGTFNGGNAEPSRTVPPVRDSKLLGTARKGLGGRVPRCATPRIPALCRALTCQSCFKRFSRERGAESSALVGSTSLAARSGWVLPHCKCNNQQRQHVRVFSLFPTRVRVSEKCLVWPPPTNVNT